MSKPKVLLLWEDNKGKFHKMDAYKAIPNIIKDMQENLDQYRTITVKKKIKLHKTPKSHLRKMIP